MDKPSNTHGLVLAVELGAEARAASLRLGLESASYLADHVALDLQRLAPGIQSVGVALSAALYVQAQLLRPGFPIYADLVRLYRADAGEREDVPHIVAFGTSADRMASQTLEPDPRLVGGPLLFIPIALVEHSVPISALLRYLDEELENTGLADARTALYLAEAFSLPVEHARYLTRTDLCALCAVQLEHAGLGAAWVLIEAALFGGLESETIQTLAGQRIEIAAGRAQLPTPRYVDFANDADAALLDALRELRQYAALLEAHAIPFVTAEGPASEAWIETVSSSHTPNERAIFAHHSQELGTIALTLASKEGGAWHAIKHAYAATRTGLDRARRDWAEQHGIDENPRRLDGLQIAALNAGTLNFAGG
jgi:hypothetical protein